MREALDKLAASAGGAKSVSYTHLDVYKRQADQCAGFFGWGRGLFHRHRIAFQLAAPVASKCAGRSALQEINAKLPRMSAHTPAGRRQLSLALPEATAADLALIEVFLDALWAELSLIHI